MRYYNDGYRIKIITQNKSNYIVATKSAKNKSRYQGIKNQN